MMIPSPAADLRQRNLLFLATPSLRTHWPFLPLVRRVSANEEYGVLFDALRACNIPGLSATVMLCNLFELPTVLEELLALPHETFDTPDEIYAAGWRVD